MGELGMPQASLINTAANVAAPVLGLAYNSIFHKQQVRHQQDFINQQMEAQRAMGIFNQKQALEMWDKTNYDAQRKQMEKAGLNPGLMYGHAGAGAQTVGGQAGNVTGGQAPGSNQSMAMGLQLAAQLKLLNAQADNLNASTRNMLSGANKQDAEIPKIGAETQNVETDTRLKETQIKLNDFYGRIAKIGAEISEDGKSLVLGKLDAEYKKLIADTQLTESEKAKVDAETINVGLQSALIEANVNLTKAETDAIAVKIEQEWTRLKLEARKTNVSELELQQKAAQIGLNAIQTEFDTGNWAKVGVITKSLGTLFGTIIGAAAVSKK